MPRHNDILGQCLSDSRIDLTSQHTLSTTFSARHNTTLTNVSAASASTFTTSPASLPNTKRAREEGEGDAGGDLFVFCRKGGSTLLGRIDATGGTQGDTGAVLTVCTQCPEPMRQRLLALARVDVDARPHTAQTWRKNSQAAQRALQPYFGDGEDDGEKQDADLYRRLDKVACERVVAENAARAGLEACHSCLTPGQHAAYHPVIRYYAQTGRIDYVKAVLCGQWPRPADRSAYERLACEANGVFSLFPDTALVLDLVRAETAAYLRHLKRLYLSRRCRRDALTDTAAYDEEKEEGREGASEEGDAVDSSLSYRNANYLQEPHARGFAQRRRRRCVHDHIELFLSEALQHRQALEAACGKAPTGLNTAEEGESDAHTHTHGGATVEASAESNTQDEPVRAEEDEAFDFFAEEDDGDTPTASSAASQNRTTPREAHHSGASAPSRTKAKHSTANKKNTNAVHAEPVHIQDENLFRVVWAMDEQQFRSRYEERQVPAVSVSALRATTRTATPSTTAQAPSSTHTSTSPGTARVVVDRVLDVVHLDEACTDSPSTRSNMSQLSQMASSLPPRWFVPRVQGDTLLESGDAPSLSTTAATPGAPPPPAAGPSPVLPMLSAQSIADCVAGVALSVDVAAVCALLKAAVNPAGMPAASVRLPVRVQVMPPVAAGHDDTNDTAPSRPMEIPSASSSKTGARLHVSLGAPFPSKMEPRRAIMAQALTALMDATVMSSVPSTFLARSPLQDASIAGTSPSSCDVFMAAQPTTPITVCSVEAGHESLIAEVELHRVAPEMSPTNPSMPHGVAKCVPAPPDCIPFRVFARQPWRLASPPATGAEAERPVFRLVKPEYLNASDGAEEDVLQGTHNSAEGDQDASPSARAIYLEAMNIHEATEISCLLHCFPDALVIVPRVNAYTGDVLATDVWDTGRWHAFLAAEQQRHKIHAHASGGGGASAKTSPQSGRKNAPHHPHEANELISGDVDVLAAAPPPLALSERALTVLSHAWDCLFDSLDRLCLQLAMVTAQQLMAKDGPQMSTMTGPRTMPTRCEEAHEPLLELDFLLVKTVPPAETAPPSSAPARGRAQNRSVRRPLFKLSLGTPCKWYKDYEVPFSLESDVLQGLFIEKASLRACHEQYLPASTWPFADRIPFTFNK